MFLTFEELFAIEGMKQARLIAGNEGIHRLIKGAHVVEMIDAKKWVKSGELLFISGVGLENMEQDLLHIIQDVYEKGAAGIVVEVGPYIKEITKKEKDLADHLGFPVLALPFEVNISDIISKTFYMIYEKEKGNKVLSDFMKEVMITNHPEELEDKAKLLGYHCEQGHIAIVWSVEDLKCQKQEPIDLEQVYTYVRNEFSSEKTLFYVMEEHCITTIVSYSKEEKAILDRKIKRVCSKMPQMVVSIGVGTLFHGIKHLPNSVIAAKKALELIADSTASGEVCYYNEMGIYRIFAELQKQNLLKKVMNEELGVLFAYDEKNKSELVHTLEVYLQTGSNISRATELLFVHRNTVKQRIKRIGELLEKDLSDSNEVFNLQLAFKIKNYLKI
ncbi:MAG: PucR family transcriptional regulator ligand-binding domain-containing protein [bacterium]|nr:PucR family transcriptional regulator ligand-binding domain-containing protein [bacterium]